MANGGDLNAYSFAGISHGGWLSKRFNDDFGRFPYIGARKRLLKMQQEKSIGRRMFEALSRRAKLTTVLGYVSEKILGWRPPQGSEPNKLADELFKILDEERNKQALEKFLTETQNKCRSHHRFFDKVSGWRLVQGGIFAVDQKLLKGEIVVVPGQLVHRDAIAQYNATFAMTVARLPGEWLLADMPPFGMIDDNERFDGNVLSLVTEPDFDRMFRYDLPFRKDIGWYPYCRVTGFFQEPASNESMPSLEIIMVEFRRPKPYESEKTSCFSFLKDEVQMPNYLEKRWEFLCASYMLPLLAKGSNLENFKVSADQKKILQDYVTKAGADLPAALANWYTSV